MREFIRKFIHIFFGSIIIAAYLYTSTPVMLEIMGACLVLGFLISQAMERGIQIPFFNQLVKVSERENEKQFIGQGALLFFAGFFLTLLLDYFWIQNKTIILASLAILVYGDGFSAIIGKVLGTHKILGNKTVEGSTGFFLVAFIFSFVITSSTGTAVLISIIASLTEILPVNDNLSIPLVSSVALKLVL
ncbi:MAG: hypothetical protein Q7S92_03405 [Candidatus Diapherotrites archaeon]|nr:hypothetical protein [Candidatus Diapherotrites archaeon]